MGRFPSVIIRPNDRGDAGDQGDDHRHAIRISDKLIHVKWSGLRLCQLSRVYEPGRGLYDRKSIFSHYSVFLYVSRYGECLKTNI